ncbi:hypothetical protein SAICODRAFT_32201 [Saitoella complicata NRRL Y-17804]|uniref:uncharacterized protein n=1 Tax=Saitoella complicata (strain BCRC 22490 / CBS 7301 / JCM 7358 / NBRC 10748 / NRRL Y-17804) TaxID=698492 RepID=UPI00086717BA|nr:uncharacterized protein SAICODRAFT_32201 [Saitoella complicata NRRL Y-17804]ODQ49863.1 hypothetical protein SAICODRAFT_32201 [Saitoella complicata NRRL Y-17804]
MHYGLVKQWASLSSSFLSDTKSLYDNPGLALFSMDCTTSNGPVAGVMLANLPQLAFSAWYFLFNRQLTRICLENEWRRFY